jgi:hypothetical protein
MPISSFHSESENFAAPKAKPGYGCLPPGTVSGQEVRDRAPHGRACSVSQEEDSHVAAAKCHMAKITCVICR